MDYIILQTLHLHIYSIDIMLKDSRFSFLNSIYFSCRRNRIWKKNIIVMLLIKMHTVKTQPLVSDGRKLMNISSMNLFCLLLFTQLLEIVEQK